MGSQRFISNIINIFFCIFFWCPNIGIGTNNNLNNGLVQTDNYPKAKGIAAEIACDLDIQGYLESGSIGLKICRVAEGKAHLFVKDIELYDWDVAAPHLILRESGGS